MTDEATVVEVVRQSPGGITGAEVAAKLGWENREAVSALVRAYDDKLVLRTRVKTGRFKNVGIWSYSINPSPPPKRVRKKVPARILTEAEYAEARTRC